MSMALTISTINIVPRQPNENPKQPYLGPEPSGSSSESNTKIRPISGVKITDKINAKPKPIFLRLPKNPTKTSSNKPDASAKITIEDTILFVLFGFPFHSIECSEWQLLASSVGEI